jgi:hypothetical protein
MADEQADVVIEEYRIEPFEKEGFPKLRIKFEDASGKVHRFEMHPAYAHHFSDDLLKNAARQLAPKVARG